MGLRMTAMIDVIFLLLTFFILTAKFPSPESRLPVVMPKPATQGSSNPQSGPLIVQLKAAHDGCQVVIDNSDSVALSQTAMDSGLSALADKIAAASKSYDVATQGVEIRCDNLIQWDYVVKVYDILYRMGATKITFLTKEKTADAP